MVAHTRALIVLWSLKSSPSAAASAMWRTPLLDRPKPVTADAVDMMAFKIPKRPIPAGPNNTAKTFAFIMPVMIATREPVPTMAVARTMCPVLFESKGSE
jgi:hypothetical protein